MMQLTTQAELEAALRAVALTLRELPPEVIGRVVQRCWFLADRSQAEAVALAIADALENPDAR